MGSLLKQISDDIEKKAIAEDWERMVQASVSFQRQHLNDEDGGYYDIPENTTLMQLYIKGHELLWTVDSLNEAYTNLKGSLVPAPTPTAATPAVAPVPVPAVEENLPAWGRLDHARVVAMSGKEMQKWMKYSGFQEAVDALRIPENTIKRGF